MFLAMRVKDRDHLKVTSRVNLGELSVSQGAAMLAMKSFWVNRTVLTFKSRVLAISAVDINRAPPSARHKENAETHGLPISFF